jgi:hypothetical protein
MHYNIGNRWERIKLFTRLQPEYKEILFSCAMNDHIRNLSKSRREIVSVIQMQNISSLFEGRKQYEIYWSRKSFERIRRSGLFYRREVT